MSDEQKLKVIDDGGPAHPSFDEVTGEYTGGMSLRMWLAGQVMNGLLSDAEYDGEPQACAVWSFRYADALIAESKRNELRPIKGPHPGCSSTSLNG